MFEQALVGDNCLIPLGSAPMQNRCIEHLLQVNRAAIHAEQLEHHLFRAMLVASDRKSLLLEQENVDTVNYTEVVLIRIAQANYT